MVAALKASDAGRLALVAVALTIAYAITAKLGFQLAVLAEQVTTVWAPTGIAMAGLLLWGRRLWPAVWLGAFIANAGTSAPVWTAVAIATGNTLEAVIAASLLRRTGGFDPAMARLADAARLIIVASVLATAVSATVGVVTLCVADLQPWSGFWRLWSTWWLGDALGALVVAPAILTVVRSSRNSTRPDWAEIGVLVVASMAVTQLLFGPTLAALFGEGLLHYVVFPLVVIAAVRFGQPATALVVLSVSAVAIWNTARGAGPFASTEMHRGLILLQAFISVVAATGLMLAAAMSERRTGERRRAASSGIGDLLADAASLADAAPMVLQRICDNLGWQIGAIWLADPDGQRLRCTAVWNGIGLAAQPFERMTNQLTFASGAGLPGRVWATGRAVWIEDVVRDPNFARAAVAEQVGIHGAFGFPIRLGNDDVGVVECFTRDVAVPDDDLLATMSTVGHQLGQFISRKRVEGAIVEEQRRTRAILDTALDAVIAMDHHGVITEFNPAAERAFGYARTDALGRELADLIIPPDLRDRHRAGLARHLATGEGPFLNQRVETRGYHADGHEFPIEVAIIRMSDDGPPRFTGFVRDLTARKLAEDAVQMSEERFRTLAASNSALTLYEQDRDLRYRWVFPQHREFPDHNIGKTDDELIPAGEGAALTAIKRRVIDTGVGCREEITVTLPSESRSYDVMVEPRRDDTGAIIGVSGVAVDITERKCAEQRLRDSEARLREADRHKDEFLAVLAHELRNPLAPIRTGLHFARVADDPAGAVTQILPMMERQVGHMVRLIDDLLDVSRISSGKIRLQRQPASLADIVNGAVEANRAAIEEAGIRLEVTLPDAPLTLLVDTTRMVQVLSNLLHNAAKFTNVRGTIALTAEVARGAEVDQLLLSVTDDGIGISSAMLPRVFELFTQADQTGERGQSGLGIGLALARRIVELHDGHIEAHSAGPDAGSRFTIRLPLLVTEVAAPVEARAEADRGVAVRRVLIIDDNADAADMMAVLVGAMGADAETAVDGREGIRRASAFAPDLIFLDIGMPEMDGYEVCRRIRQEAFGRNVTIVALTGWGQERDKQRAIDAGFDTHLTKPADPVEIRRLISGLGAVASKSV